MSIYDVEGKWLPHETEWHWITSTRSRAYALSAARERTRINKDVVTRVLERPADAHWSVPGTVIAEYPKPNAPPRRPTRFVEHTDMDMETWTPMVHEYADKRGFVVDKIHLTGGDWRAVYKPYVGGYFRAFVHDPAQPERCLRLLCRWYPTRGWRCRRAS